MYGILIYFYFKYIFICGCGRSGHYCDHQGPLPAMPSWLRS